MSSEVVFSFDTTGSMSPCIAQVRANVDKLCAELFKEIPDLKIGLISHGDYCDGLRCIDILPLTNDPFKVKKFVVETPNTGGGDAPECYELVLNKVREMGWGKETNKLFVMIGDNEPHHVGYPTSPYKGGHNIFDWRKEVSALKELGIMVYGLQCLYPIPFWNDFAKEAGTPLLRLTNFAAASEILKGFVYVTAGSDAFSRYESRIEVLTPETEKHNSVLRMESLKFDKKLEESVKEAVGVMSKKRVLSPE